MKTTALFTLVILLISCQNKKEPEKTYLCKCEEVIENVNSEIPAQKVIYIFLVTSNKMVSCCEDNLITSESGFKETWTNGAPDHPKVWGSSETGLEKITALEAFNLGCSLEKKEIAAEDISKSAHQLGKYYPELVK